MPARAGPRSEKVKLKKPIAVPRAGSGFAAATAHGPHVAGYKYKNQNKKTVQLVSVWRVLLFL